MGEDGTRWSLRSLPTQSILWFCVNISDWFLPSSSSVAAGIADLIQFLPDTQPWFPAVSMFFCGMALFLHSKESAQKQGYITELMDNCGCWGISVWWSSCGVTNISLKLVRYKVCKGAFYSGPLTASTVEIKSGHCVSLKGTRRMRFWNNFPIEKMEANNQTFIIQGNLWHAKMLRSPSRSRKYIAATCLWAIMFGTISAGYRKNIKDWKGSSTC